MLGDREVAEFRHEYYGLFVLLWWREPSADWIRELGREIGTRSEAAAALHPLMGKGWQTIGRFLAERPPETVAEEFTKLFIGPFDPKVNPYESYYLAGKFFSAPLANLRAFLKRLGLEKRQEQFFEPEDYLAFELEVMHWLVGRQLAEKTPEQQRHWLQPQREFLNKHLLVWGPACARDMESCDEARFYRGAAMLLRGFLELESELFRELGLERIPPLDEIRRQYGAQPEWKGVTFEAPASGSSRESSGK